MLTFDFNPHGLRLRGLFALSVRAVARVRPILGDRPASDIDRAIKLAASFARGERVGLSVARRIAERAHNSSYPVGGGYPRHPTQNTWYVVAAGSYLGHAALSAFNATVRTPPSRACIRSAVAGCTKALDHASSATEPWPNDRLDPHDSRFSTFARQFPERAEEVQIARMSLQRDYQIVQTTHAGRPQELGLAIDPGTDGSLGPLWAGRPPEWYLREAASTAPAQNPVSMEEYSDSLVDRIRSGYRAVPDVVYWHMDAETALASLDEEFHDVQRASRESGRPPPALVVFTPEVVPDTQRAIARMGAVVFETSRNQPQPWDVEILQEWLETRPGVIRPHEAVSELFPGVESARSELTEADRIELNVRYERVLKLLNAEPWWTKEY